MLLDLGLPGHAISITPTSEHNDMDFPAFLLLYASLCGLCVRGSEKEEKEKEGLWVPTRTGYWQKVSQSHLMMSRSEHFVKSVLQTELN